MLTFASPVRQKGMIMQDLLQRLGRLVEIERKKRQYTQKALADRTGVSRSTIQKIEAGIPVRTDCLSLVMDALGLTFSIRDVDSVKKANAVATCFLEMMNHLSFAEQAYVWNNINHIRLSN